MKIIRLIIGFCCVLSCCTVTAQYAPAAGKTGSTALFMDSTAIIAWADSCTIQRGWKDIGQKDSGYVSYGEISNSIGKANGKVLSLGDSGVVTLAFIVPIINGPGADFVVFENGISDNFLELGFVEVSSDGVTFVRFPAISLTDTASQTGPFAGTDPTKLNNLAGKYRARYGVPFDLDELKNIRPLDVSNITYIRIVDVVGSMNDAFASKDSRNVKVNDPYPTLFASGGFDLDAVGVLFNKEYPTSIMEDDFYGMKVYPTLAMPNEEIQLVSNNKYHLTVFNSHGQILIDKNIVKGGTNIKLTISGMYYLRLISKEGNSKVQKIVVR